MKQFLYGVFITTLLFGIPVGYYFCYDMPMTPEQKLQLKIEREKEEREEEIKKSEKLMDNKAHIMTDLNGKKYSIIYTNKTDNNWNPIFLVIRVSEENRLEKE